MIERTAENDDQLMVSFLEGHDIDNAELVKAIRRATIAGKINPVLCGTALKDKGVQRLLDGEADASTGDITDAKAWEALENTPTVKRMFPDYVELNRKLWQEKGIFTPVHIIVMGGKLNREHPDLAKRLYDAFVQSKELAYSDALGEGTSYSMLFAMRETMRDQLATLGDMYPYGIKANQGTIDMFLDYNVQQGLTKNRMTVDQIFAKGTLDT